MKKAPVELKEKSKNMFEIIPAAKQIVKRRKGKAFQFKTYSFI